MLKYFIKVTDISNQPNHLHIFQASSLPILGLKIRIFLPFLPKRKKESLEVFTTTIKSCEPIQ